MNMTKNELADAIAKIDPAFVYTPKKQTRDDLIEMFERAKSAAAENGFTKTRNVDERSVWPRENSRRAQIMKLMLSDSGCTIDDIVKLTGWSRNAAASFFSTDIHGYRNRDEKWTGCNFTYHRRGSSYFLEIHDDAPTKPEYL